MSKDALVTLISWSLNPIPTTRNQVLGEVSKSRSAAGGDKMSLEHLIMPESKEMLKKKKKTSGQDRVVGNQNEGPPTGQVWAKLSTKIVMYSNDYKPLKY